MTRLASYILRRTPAWALDTGRVTADSLDLVICTGYERGVQKRRLSRREVAERKEGNKGGRIFEP